MTATATLAQLAAEHPEWRPWTAPLEATLREIPRPAWERCVPRPVGDRSPDAPLLSGATVEADARLVRRWVGELFHAAAGAGAPVSPRPAALDPLALLEAALTDDRPRLQALAAGAGQDPAALAALAPLAAMPLLQACLRRLHPAISATWTAGYCPLCGAWPALAEARGLERARRLRCAACGADWAGAWLQCPFCGERDHERLVALVSATHGDTRKVDACLRCRGYLKSLTTLSASAGPEVILDDLATVDLDAAALEHGYRRPDARAQALDLGVRAAPRGLARLVTWAR